MEQHQEALKRLENNMNPPLSGTRRDDKEGRWNGFQDRCLKPLGHPSLPAKSLPWHSAQNAHAADLRPHGDRKNLGPSRLALREAADKALRLIVGVLLHVGERMTLALWAGSDRDVSDALAHDLWV